MIQRWLWAFIVIKNLFTIWIAKLFDDFAKKIINRSLYFRNFDFFNSIWNNQLMNVSLVLFDRFGSKIDAWKINANVSSIGRSQPFIMIQHLLLRCFKLQPLQLVCLTTQQLRWFHKCLWSLHQRKFHRLTWLLSHTAIVTHRTKFRIEIQPIFNLSHIRQIYRL